MICTKCGSSLEDNAKFCTKCGTAISFTDENLQNEVSCAESIVQQSTSVKPSIQQTPYEAPATPYGQYAQSTIQQSSNNITPYQIVQPTPKASTKSIAIIALIILLLVSVGLIISNLYTSNLRLQNELKANQNMYENDIQYYQDQLDEYENENAIDKTVDALSSWFDFLY